ncbi:MAG: D-glycero-alpha-D-manno-heptose-1,7-bisphosphate 7-phosphatase [Dehalococcoidia bacterium]
MVSAVFLDRDGTINRDVSYCSRPQEVALLPGVAQAIRAFNRLGLKVVVITNQSGVARGYFDEAMLAQIHIEMERRLAAQGARIDAIYYCPHHPDDGCPCRKPGTALAWRAARELEIDVASSWVVGDAVTDVAMGRRLGCRTILLTSSGESPSAATADLLVPDLGAAARHMEEVIRVTQGSTSGQTSIAPGHRPSALGKGGPDKAMERQLGSRIAALVLETGSQKFEH